MIKRHLDILDTVKFLLFEWDDDFYRYIGLIKRTVAKWRRSTVSKMHSRRFIVYCFAINLYKTFFPNFLGITVHLNTCT